MEKKVKIGVIGAGNMGLSHVYSAHELPNSCLTAVCDIDQAKLDRIKPELREKIGLYRSSAEFFDKADIDAVIISVPHYDHVPLAIEALKRGKHILVEKPISVEKQSAMELLEESAKHPDLVQCLMFCQRTLPPHIKIKKLIESGELGKIKRVNWIVTDWFRTQFYYDSGDWRASWRGEGGGVLLNQCPHQLDLLQWFFGMPEKVRCAVKLGKYHDIEVEDEINAYLEYADGKTANFISSTGEAPGINRLEITGERGLLTLENNKITFKRNEVETTEFNRTSKSRFGTPDCWQCEIPVPAPGGIIGHEAIIVNVAQTIQKKAELIAPLAEGIRGLELGNAMLYSGLNDVTVKLPLDSQSYADMLGKLIESSRWEPKKISNAAVDDSEFAKSF